LQAYKCSRNCWFVRCWLRCENLQFFNRYSVHCTINHGDEIIQP